MACQEPCEGPLSVSGKDPQTVSDACEHLLLSCRVLQTLKSLTLVQWYLSQDLLGYLLPFVASHYGLAKVIPVANDLRFEIMKNCAECFPSALGRFFPGGDGIIHAVNILQDTLGEEVVGLDNESSIACQAIRAQDRCGALFEEPQVRSRVSCMFSFGLLTHPLLCHRTRHQRRKDVAC
jgi:hypothetical protein